MKSDNDFNIFICYNNFNIKIKGGRALEVDKEEFISMSEAPEG